MASFKNDILLREAFARGVKQVFGEEIATNDLIIGPTRKEFEGDVTVTTFPLVPKLKKAPHQIAESMGEYLVDSLDFVVQFNVIKGFLNLTLSVGYWLEAMDEMMAIPNYGNAPANGEKVMIEFSSPNTNKPLHLGHIRNILLGWSCAKLMQAAGFEVIKTQIINDRGIAICKSMLAWQKWGNNETPESTGTKGDHFVGSFYVRFEQEFQKEYKIWQETEEAVQLFHEKGGKADSEKFFKTYKNNYFNRYSALGAEATQMLELWEQGDANVRELWERMNSWVYAGFEKTYKGASIEFDKLYYESDTYLLGKDVVEKGLKKGVFYKKEDGSVWIDLTDIGMDEKIVMRSNGTSVYITQDIGTALLRYNDFGVKRMIYVVADEQEYHFKVLFEIMKRLDVPFKEGMFHLSYGMVDLPSGRMKSREGTVVDADDLVKEVITEATKNAQERGELNVDPEKNETIRKIGMAALKYFILKVNAKKRMIFDPSESVDMQGQTGPYIQNAYVRILSMLRKNDSKEKIANQYLSLEPMEKELIQLQMQYPDIIQEAATSYNPAILANYLYALAKTFHKYYHDVRILSADTPEAKQFRLMMSEHVASVLKKGMNILGIEMPDRM